MSINTPMLVPNPLPAEVSRLLDQSRMDLAGGRPAVLMLAFSAHYDDRGGDETYEHAQMAAQILREEGHYELQGRYSAGGECGKVSGESRYRALVTAMDLPTWQSTKDISVFFRRSVLACGGKAAALAIANFIDAECGRPDGSYTSFTLAPLQSAALLSGVCEVWIDKNRSAIPVFSGRIEYSNFIDQLGALSFIKRRHQ